MTRDDLTTLFGGYDAIALVANSEGMNLAFLDDILPEKTLFAFFNRCDKVLSQPFGRDCVHFLRLVAASRFLDSQRHIERAGQMLPQLKRRIGVFAQYGCTGEDERRNAPLESTVSPDTLDFDYLCPNIYPAHRVPSTGFAVAMSLVEHVRGPQIYLCGFNGVPGVEHSMNARHDWMFENTVFKLLEKRQRLQRIDTALTQNSQSLQAVSKLFPDIDRTEIALAATEALDMRFMGMEMRVAKLWQMSGGIRKIKTFFRPLRKRIRKLLP